MPRKSAIKCYFGCATEVSGPFHQFPKPEYPNLEKFEQWKMVLNEDVKTKGDSFIFNNIRICDCHFEEFYRSASKRLTGNAVPTLNLSSTSPIVLQPSSSVETEMDIDMQIGDNLEPFKLPYPKQKLLPREYGYRTRATSMSSQYSNSTSIASFAPPGSSTPLPSTSTTSNIHRNSEHQFPEYGEEIFKICS
ncbi:unnamed protein product [Parnassius apollo]|uniref:(apollo) hypothetical protein n=1 Tax=Parnassius apollo TaxID=110799 RepID=A0A8S3WPZ0_PARAO|nr:unnamed protein product [Parnassius apollo]